MFSTIIVPAPVVPIHVITPVITNVPSNVVGVTTSDVVVMVVTAVILVAIVSFTAWAVSRKL